MVLLQWPAIAPLLLLLLPSALGQGASPSCSSLEGGINMCGYQSHQQMVARLQSLQQRYPGIASVGSVGRSAAGKHLAYIRITGNASSPER